MRRLAAVLAVPLMLLLVACGDDGPTDGGTADAGSTTTRPAGDGNGNGDGGGVEVGPGVSDTEIRIGVHASVTGPSSAIGIGARRGIELAVAEINDAGGINGRTLTIVFEDDEGTLEGGVATARRLTDADVFGILSGGSSLATQGTLDLVDQAEIPYLSIIASDPAVLEAGSPWIFMGGTVPQADIVAAQSTFLIEELGLVRVAQLVCDLGFCEQGAAEWARVDADSDEFEIIETQTFTTGSADFTAQVEAIRRADPDVIRVAGLPADAGNFVRQLRQAGVDAQILGDPAFASDAIIEIAGNAAEGAITGFVAAEQFVSDDTGAMGEWRARYQAHFPGEEPVQQALIGYADTYVFAEALRLVGDELTREAFVAALQTLDGFVAGDGNDWDAIPIGLPRTFSPDDHQGNRSVIPLIVRDGRWLPYSD